MSAHQHVSDDVFIDGLYGLADVQARVGTCALCASRWNEMQEKRAAIAVPMEVPVEVLAAQRRNIYARIEHPLRIWEQLAPMRWTGPTVAVAAACLLAVGVFVHHPGSAVTPVRPMAVSMSETQQLPEVYSDVYSMEQSFEPAASASFRVLFEADGTPAEGAEQGTTR
jgi:hypothetical protein